MVKIPFTTYNFVPNLVEKISISGCPKSLIFEIMPLSAARWMCLVGLCCLHITKDANLEIECDTSET